MRTPGTRGRSRSLRNAVCEFPCRVASERSRDRCDRRSGAAAAQQGARTRGDRLARDPAPDRRLDRDETRGERGRDRREPGRRGPPRGDRRGRGRQPPLSLQACRAADGDDQSGHRAPRGEENGDQRGLPVGPRPARQPRAPSRRARSLSRSRGRRTRGREARPDRRHLPARGRPPERHPVRGPRRPADLRHLGAVRSPPAGRVRASCSRDRRGARGLTEEPVSTLWCELAWLGGGRTEAGVLIGLDGERIASVSTGVDVAPPGSSSLHGLTIPGLANAHSHAFQRALRGRTQAERGDFWTWRRRMYEIAEAIQPDGYRALARATFGEMALAGITAVGEFHYLHHGSGGVPYEDPNEMGEAVVSAAGEAGIRITLLDTCYLNAGVHQWAEGVQRRFSDGSAEAWAERVARLEPGAGNRLGAAIHSVRAVDPESAAVVADFAGERSWPLHAHVSEQPRENEECESAYGTTPAGLLARAGALSERFTAVHATHLADADFRRLSDARSGVCLCPTTERDLADGVGPARRLAESGVRLSLGTDSHASIDLFEEARAVELDQRLVTGLRGGHSAAVLLDAATAGGCEAIGWPEAGRIAPGALADLVTVGLDGVRLAGASPREALESVVFAATASDVRNVFVGGEVVVRNGAHANLDVARELDDAISRLSG